MGTENRTWWLYWADVDWPADGIIGVEAKDERSAYVAGDAYMQSKADQGDGPQNWRWEYAPSDRKPNYLE